MKLEKTSQLYDQKKSLAFYQARYKKGYMDEWPDEKKRKIVEIIHDIKLQPEGEALDFGCGNGILTEVLRQAIPSWKIYGTDISKKAIANARRRYPECIFFEAGSPDFKQKKFDFVFTNHVFEHVFNLYNVFNDLDEYLKPESSMLHVLPCGNKGSFEYNICILRKDGIDPELENRFFFEDKSHVRRLTTDEFCKLCQTKDFKLEKEYYSYQFYGAVDWITTSRPKFVLMFLDASQAINKKAGLMIKIIGIFLIIITLLRQPSQIIPKFFTNKKKQFIEYLMFLPELLFFILSKPIDKYWKKRAKEEWDQKKHYPNGSEMALYFKRN